MNLADLSVRRPTFITCIVLLIIAVGYSSMKRLGVDLFPDVTFPVVFVSVPYPGAGPSEIETLVAKPLEEELSTISGLKRLSSTSQEGVGTVVAEFTLETDVKFAEQQIRDKVSSAKRKLPLDIKEPVIRRLDPADQPVVTLSIEADLPPSELYDLANEVIRPSLEQVKQVGLVEVIGGRKREIHVELDRDKLKSRELSATMIAARMTATGQDVPVGKLSVDSKETIFRTLGQFNKLEDIGKSLVSFFGSDVPTQLNQVGTIKDTLVDEKSRVFVNGKQTLVLMVFRQSGANTIAVVDGVKDRLAKLTKEFENSPGKPKFNVIRDMSWWIRVNVADVQESITIGIILAVIVVFFFLGSGRSTIITGLALPNSLIGAFILMAAAGFTVNIMTLLALSLSVGLLVDDAIVVRENIFRHIELGKSPREAALIGTKEVTLAVIATTLTILAVFGPVGFLKGVVGQFFKQFGLTICFAMLISLFDALTIAPMLSAYFAGATHNTKESALWRNTVGLALRAFGRFQDWLDRHYEGIVRFTLRRPILVLSMSFVISLASCSAVMFVPKTFLPVQESGEFAVTLELPPGTNLDDMTKVALQADKIMRDHKEVAISQLTVGNREGEAQFAEFYVKLIPFKQRTLSTTQTKALIREDLKVLARANPIVKDYDAVGGGQRPFTLNIIGLDQKQLEEYAQKAFKIVKENKALLEPDLNFRAGKPELQVVLDKSRSDGFGVSSVIAGTELRALVEGVTPAKFRENGKEYDIRLRLKEDQRNLKDNFNKTFVPNINNNLVRLADVANPVEATGPSKITRQDRGRYYQIAADIVPGQGLGDAMNELTRRFETELKLPQGMRYAFVGQAENFKELNEGMATALGFGVLFIFLVLASLYESFVTPITIMLALPLALCGAFVSLLVMRESLNIFSMIGSIMLLGVAAKNSILLVDYANQRVQSGVDRATAMIEAGRTRLRPILMTTMALIAGTLPIAMGLNEASKQRTGMGVAIIGGLISSTLLTLIVIPAAYSYIDRFRVWSNRGMKKIFTASNPDKPEAPAYPNGGATLTK